MTEQPIRQQTEETRSVLSRCGSISGDTFISLRSRRNCPASRAPHKIDLLAQHLKEYHSKTVAQQDGQSLCNDADQHCQRQRLNKCFHHYRFVIAMLAGASVGTMMFLRYSMTIAILSMVNQTHLYLEEHPNKTMQDFLDEGYSPVGEFLWNNEIVAIILSWYMFSYTLPQTLVAKWTIALGCRYAIPLALLVCSISNILTPTAAYMSWEWVVVCRIINGIGAAGVVPGMIKLLEDWMRYDELSSGLTTAQFLSACMAAICPLVSGYLTDIHWSATFYVPSYATFVFCIVWILMVTNKPRANSLISERELKYLCECDIVSAKSIRTVSKQVQDDESNQPRSTLPSTNSVDNYSYKPDSWVQVLKLRQFQAYVAIWIINCSSFTCLTFVLPAYMRQFLKIRISENGFYCFIIQTGVVIAVSWPHQCIRMLLARKLTMTRARVLLQGVCTFMMAATFIYVGTFHEYQLPLLFLNRCFMTSDVIVTGSVMSNFAKAGVTSLAFAMINTVGNLSITGSSSVVGWLLDYTGSSELGWRIIFYAFAVAQISMFLIFALFVDSEPVKFKRKSNKDNTEQGAPSAFVIENLKRELLKGGKQQLAGSDSENNPKCPL